MRMPPPENGTTGKCRLGLAFTAWSLSDLRVLWNGWGFGLHILGGDGA